MSLEIMPASTFKEYAQSSLKRARLKKILSLCWVTTVKSGCSCYGTSEPWDTGETWCYAIFCPEGLHEELSAHYYF